jgi:hypothetical protein
MKTIPLNRGYVAEVDDDQYERLSVYKWYPLVMKKSRTVYAFRSVLVDGKQRNVYMHREIVGATEKEQVDHRDGNGLRNLEENLRKCTHRQNMMNQKKWTKKTYSRFKGVTWNKNRKNGKCWVSAIKCNGKRYHLGSFYEEDDAAIVYNVAAQIFFGSFSNLNPV